MFDQTAIGLLLMSATWDTSEVPEDADLVTQAESLGKHLADRVFDVFDLSDDLGHDEFRPFLEEVFGMFVLAGAEAASGLGDDDETTKSMIDEAVDAAAERVTNEVLSTLRSMATDGGTN